jgi:hypothetical protein
MPNTICKRPDSKNTARIMGNALLIDPSKLDKISAIKTILTAVIGAVGPDIWVGVPPKKAAKKLIKIAPYKPALGPNPELKPNASASGRATIPAVIPPKKSPLKFEKSNFNTFLNTTTKNINNFQLITFSKI